MNKTGEIGAVILRLVLGFTFFMHGYDKFQGGIDNTAGFFSSLGLPGFMAYIVGGIEVVGGIAVIMASEQGLFMLYLRLLWLVRFLWLK